MIPMGPHFSPRRPDDEVAIPEVFLSAVVDRSLAGSLTDLARKWCCYVGADGRTVIIRQSWPAARKKDSRPLFRLSGPPRHLFAFREEKTRVPFCLFASAFCPEINRCRPWSARGSQTGAGAGAARRPRETAAQWTQSSKLTPEPEGGGSLAMLPVQTSNKATRTIASACARR